MSEATNKATNKARDRDNPSRSSLWTLALLGSLVLTTLSSCQQQPKPVREGLHWHVAEGQDLQYALNHAVGGEEILLQPGAVYEGNFVLPARPESDRDWVRVRVAELRMLPPQGERLTVEASAGLPRMVSPNGEPVVRSDRKAHHFRFQGVVFALASGKWANNHVEIGDGREGLSDLPHHIDFDQVVLLADPQQGSVRGVAMNGHHLSVRNSSIVGYGRPKLDTQAVCAWNSPGPLWIANNYLEGAAENIMLGGGTPAIPGLVATDVQIMGNHLRKPLAWQQRDWVVKNLFEIKSGRHVLAKDNVMENVWPNAQRGFAIVLTVRTEDGKAPQAVVEDVALVGNWVKNATSGVNLLGRDTNGLGRTRRVLLEANRFDLTPSDRAPSRLFQLLEGVDRVSIVENGATNAGVILMSEGVPHRDFVMRGNLLFGGYGGLQGTGVPGGVAVLDRYFPGAVLQDNSLPGVAEHSDFAQVQTSSASQNETAARRRTAARATSGKAWATSDIGQQKRIVTQPVAVQLPPLRAEWEAVQRGTARADTLPWQ